MFKPIVDDHANLYQKIVSQIKKLIAQGKLQPGDRLPPERELCSLLNVSRTSIREALKILTALGLVDIRHGQGVFVAEMNTDQVIVQLASLLVARQDSIKDLFEIRKIIETQAAAWAAERAAEDEIEDIVAIAGVSVERVEAGDLSLTEAKELDTRFHNTIAEATHNAVLVRIMYNLLDILSESRSQSLVIPHRAEKSTYEHRDIAARIEGRDIRGAGDAMLRHLEGVERSIFQTS